MPGPGDVICDGMGGVSGALTVEVGRAGDLLRELITGVGGCFAPAEPWVQAGRYACQTWASATAGASRSGPGCPPYKAQRLLNHAWRDTSEVMRVIRRFVITGLGAGHNETQVPLPTAALGAGDSPVASGNKLPWSHATRKGRRSRSVSMPRSIAASTAALSSSLSPRIRIMTVP